MPELKIDIQQNQRVNSLYARSQEKGGLIDTDVKLGVIEELVKGILDGYAKDPDVKKMP